MIKIRVEYLIDKSAEEAFGAITDQENYDRYPRIELRHEAGNRIGGTGRYSARKTLRVFRHFFSASPASPNARDSAQPAVARAGSNMLVKSSIRLEAFRAWEKKIVQCHI